MISEKCLCDVKELASLLNCHPRTVNTYRKAEVFNEAYLKINNTYYYHVGECKKRLSKSRKERSKRFQVNKRER